MPSSLPSLFTVFTEPRGTRRGARVRHGHIVGVYGWSTCLECTAEQRPVDTRETERLRRTSAMQLSTCKQNA